MRTSTARVTALALALLAAAVALLALGLPSPGNFAPGELISGLVLLGAFTLCEAVPLHVEIGDDAYTASVSELPLVVGLLLLDPWVTVAARVVGAVIALFLFRRQPPVKMLFNTCSFTLEAAVPAVLIATLPCGGLLGWAAVTGAAIAGNVVSGLAVSAAIAVSGGPVRPRQLGRLVVEAAVFAGLSATVAIIGVTVYQADAGLALPLALATVGIALAYRGVTRMRRRLARLTALQAAIRDFTPAAGQVDTAAVLLSQAREKLHATVSVLCLTEPGPAGEPPVHVHLTHDGTTVLREVQPAGIVHGAVRRLGAGRVLQRKDDGIDLVALGLPDAVEAVVVPVPAAGVALLAVCDRRSDHSLFSAEDLSVLQGIAQHGSISLANAALIDRLTHDSRHDALTGLANRVEFDEVLGRHLVAAVTGCVVLLADLDGFKEVNDALGHHTGDLLLQRVADLLQASLPPQSLLARLGGDEFAVLLTGIAGEDEALAAARHLRDALAVPLRIGMVPVSVGASVGVALAPWHGTTAQELLRHADVAMYDAKVGHGVVVYDPARDTSDASRLALAGDLRAGVRRGELRLHAQPQARAVDGVVTGAEALVRWQHPTRGLLGPAEFIPLAERTGLLGEITAWVLATSLDALQHWLLAGHNLGVAVNLSPHDLSDPELTARVATALSDRHLDAHRLTLEITESTVMADPERVRATLTALRELGVRISVDDFGTGHSSLAYLGTLPVDEVKIDRSFVKDLLTDRAHRAVVGAITRLAHDLDLTVIAEGVEDAETWSHLAATGTHQMQGYHLARPMPTAALPDWITARTAAAAEAGTGAGTGDIATTPALRVVTG